MLHNVTQHSISFLKSKWSNCNNLVNAINIMNDLNGLNPSIAWGVCKNFSVYIAIHFLLNIIN